MGTIRQALDKVPKNLGNLGTGQVLYTLSVEFLLENIEPMHELCTVFFKAFRDFGLSQVLFESNTSLELEFAMQIPYKNKHQHVSNVVLGATSQKALVRCFMHPWHALQNSQRASIIENIGNSNGLRCSMLLQLKSGFMHFLMVGWPLKHIYMYIYIYMYKHIYIYQCICDDPFFTTVMCIHIHVHIYIYPNSYAGPHKTYTFPSG